jgi:dihydrofolate reductase
MQAPGAPEEDPSGGFTHGGWAFPFDDESGGEAVTGWFASAGAFLFGRRTYDIFSGFWPSFPHPDYPVAAALNTLPKYVASTTLTSADWSGTTILRGDLVTEVTKLEDQPGGELQVHGSGGLAQTLIAADLIDEYRLLFYPVHLGSGRKLFRDGAKAASLRLLTSSVTSTGVVMASYEPTGPVQYGSY